MLIFKVDGCDNNKMSDSIKDYVYSINNICRNSLKPKGGRISVYFLRDQTKDVLRICKHFSF